MIHSCAILPSRTRHAFTIRIAAFFLFAALLNAVLAHDLRVTGIQINTNNRAAILHTATSNLYYILLRGNSLTNITQPVQAELFNSTNGVLTDPAVVGPAQSAFYRVQGVLLETPLDLDGDGRDDVYELLRPLQLDPLNPNDGPQTPSVPVINYPTNATMASFVIFNGRAPTNTLIRVEGGAAFVTNTVDETGFFEVTVPLNPNRLNRLFVSAVNEFGQPSPLAPIDILQDSTAPYLFIDFPTNGAVITAESTLVAGRVGDALSGFLGLNVTVNGQAANVDIGIGPNGTFQRGQVPLAVGANTIEVIATDRLGNSMPKQITVIREQPAGPRMLALSGDLQETNILRRLALPLVVKATQPNGSPIANKRVDFTVTRSDGRLLPVNPNQLAVDITQRADVSTNGTMLLQLLTDASGEAQAWWTMGTDAGHANNRVIVSSPGISETAFFCASALALPPKQINIGSGNNQRGETFGPAPEPLKVWVSDGNNPCAAIPVTFRVVQGGGTLLPIIADDGASPAGPGLRAASRASASFMLAAAGTPPVNGSAEVTVFTAMTGHAEVDFTFGPAAGNHIIEATFPNNPSLPATFTHNALTRIPGSPTTFVGLVQDNAVQPIGNAHVELDVAGARYQTTSDADGRFAFSDIASGAGHLIVDGAPATTLGGAAIATNSFPSLQYTTLVVPNAQNSLPTSVLLPRLNTNNARWYYGTNDLVVTCEDIAGLKMTIKANSMKHPNGEIVSPGRPALVSLNQVHHDDIPMPMPDGAAPPFAWTLQPAGATFEPPVQVEYPNMSGLAPGAAAFFLTFNHNTERFEIVASGHVVEDGSRIVCDPGAGLTISGWGCNCPPYSVIAACLKSAWEFVQSLINPTAEDANSPPACTQNCPPNSNSGNQPVGNGNGPASPEVQKAGDPVIGFSGELVVEETDLEIPGRGFPFKFTRVYRSQFNDNGPMGFNWDFNYHRRLVLPAAGAPSQDIVLQNGFGRSDTYKFVPATGKFTSPRGFYDELSANLDGTFTIRGRDGFKTHFSGTGLMVSQQDRNGNTMQFLYDAANQLSEVIDTLGRSITFLYNAQSRLKRIRDFLGREIYYGYDANGDLRAVRSPVVTGTSNGNDYPDGKTVRYEYTSGFDEIADPRLRFLNHNLVAITDPREQRYLVNRYGENPDAYDFDRVVSQQSGRADQVYSFTYQALNTGVTNPPPDLPVNRTIVIDRNGNRSEFVHNGLGNALEERIATDRNVNPNDPNVFVTTYSYNSDGERLGTTFPEGNRVLYSFDSANPDRLQQGNLLEVTQLPGPRGGDQAARTVTRRYEPVYNQLLSETDSRGNDSGYTPQNGGPNSAARYTTRLAFDYQEGSSLNLLAAEMRRTTVEVQSLLNAAGMALNQGDLNGDGLNNQTRGNVIRRDDPTVRLLTDSSEAVREGDTSQEIITTYTYNRFGQLTSRTDPEGNVDDYGYHPENDPDGNGTPSTSLRTLAGDTGGYLFAVIQDNRASARRRSTAPLAQIRTERYYDPVGNLIRAVDGRGADTLLEVNALNQIIQRQSRFVTTSSGPRRYRQVYFYDANNNLIQEDIENIDATGPSLDPFVTTTYSYDLLDKRTQKTEEAATGQILVTSYAYDQNENLVRIIQPEGNATQIAYDERDLRYAVTRGAGTAQASTRTFTYNGSRNLIRAADAADHNGDGRNEEMLLTYDGYERLIRSVDAVGNELRLRYDPANGRVREQRFGRNGGASPADNSGAGNVLLSEVERSFDELNRKFQRDARLFSNVAPVGPEGPLTPGDGKVTTRFEHDRNSRLTRQLDDNAHPRRFEYDGVDRLIRTVDALNNERQFVYDGNHNLVQNSEIERSPEGLVPDEQFTTRREFDAVDRLVQIIDNLTNTVSFAYDSRNNVTRKTDALGNVTAFVHDGLNRLLVETAALRAGGTGAGAIDTSNPANPDGQNTTLYSWDRNSRLTTLADDNGNFTRYSYDALNRRTVETFADQTTKVYEHDRDDNVVRFTDNAGNVHTNRYDAVHRLVAKDVARAAGVESTTQWRFEYDGLSRRTKSSDNNDPADPTDDAVCEFRYDSLGRLLIELQGSRQVSSTFDGVGSRLLLQYPDGRIVESARDALDRIKTIRNQGSAASIAGYDYLGPWRVLERRQGNGTKLRLHDGAGHDSGYDGLKRRTALDYRRADNSVIAGFTHAFDKEDNRRFERDVFRTTADVFEYDSAYRVTRAALGLPEGNVVGIQNNNTANADVTGLSSVRQSSYRLDGVGNWRERTQDGPSTAYAVNAMNEYTSVGGVPEVHDANGNLSNDGSRRYYHDFANRLVRVTPLAGTNTIARYTYDAAGRRVKKIVGATTTEFVHDHAHEIEEREGGMAVRQYVFGGSLDEAVELKIGGGASYFYHQNILGSVVALTDLNGAAVERYAYREYGETTILDATGAVARTNSLVGNAYRYSGRRFDDESGLYHYRARYLNPILGRFLERDPKGYVDGPGLYVFTANNPLNATDPFGTERKKSEPSFKEKLDQFGKKADESDAWSATGLFTDLTGWKIEQLQEGLESAIKGQGEFISDISKTFDHVDDHARFLLEQGKIATALKQQKYWADIGAKLGSGLGYADMAINAYNVFLNPSVANKASPFIDIVLGAAGEVNHPVVKTAATSLSIGKWIGEETAVWAVPGYWLLQGMGYSEEVALEAVLDTFGK